MLVEFCKVRIWRELGLLFLAVGALVVSVPASHAQYFEVTDSTCTAGQECTGQSDQGCNRTTFTLTSAGAVDLCASIQCTDANCSHCLAIAYIYDSQGSLERCVYNQCGNTQSCEQVNLTADTYTLYCCKLDCTQEDCSLCTDDYVAKARVVLWPEP